MSRKTKLDSTEGENQIERNKFKKRNVYEVRVGESLEQNVL